MISRTHIILYVANQEASRAFYEAVLAQAPSLNVTGMTEFAIGESVTLGLMPESGILRLLRLNSTELSPRSQIRGELYLVVDDPGAYHERALSVGARELSPLAPRDWGDTVAYSLDPNGYALAFARPSHEI
jgi:catechol 2,3-dioxygenase-like lactoylglutathione lyase family enzyme